MKKNLLKEIKNRLLNNGKSPKNYDKRIKVVSTDDTEFVDKVRKMLNENKYITNPFQILMDDKKLLSLDAIGKERYLLETMDRYLKAKAIIEKEQQENNEKFA
jgi:hypothetical protein